MQCTRVCMCLPSSSSQVERFGMPTWRRLVEAVEDHVGGNNYALAQAIAAKHPGVCACSHILGNQLHPISLVPSLVPCIVWMYNLWQLRVALSPFQYLVCVCVCELLCVFLYAVHHFSLCPLLAALLSLPSSSSTAVTGTGSETARPRIGQ